MCYKPGHFINSQQDPFKKYFSQLNLLFIPGLVQQSDKIVVRYAHTIYPYSLGRYSEHKQ